MMQGNSKELSPAADAVAVAIGTHCKLEMVTKNQLHYCL